MRCSFVTFSGTENFLFEMFMSEVFSVCSEGHWGFSPTFALNQDIAMP